jgi:SAM-dependent methyltransferase
MANAKNYNRWIWQILSPHLGKSVLEIGAGIGTFTRYLKDCPKLYATDIADNCVSLLKSEFGAYPNIEIDYFDVTQIISTERWLRREVDTVVCLNVLEHIENDVEALRNIYSVTAEKSSLILMVPAFQFAYGTIDELDGHYRRYSKKDLVKKIRAAGFSICRIQYFNSIGLLAWYYTNRIVRDKSTSPVKAMLYDNYVVPFIRIAERLIEPPFGQSLIAVAEKR